MYSFSYLEPLCCSMSSSNCCFLTCIQVSQEAVQVVWYSHLFQYFPQLILIHTVKGFSIVNKAEIDVFFWNSLAFSMIQQILAIWSLFPLPFLKQLEHLEVHGSHIAEAWLRNFKLGTAWRDVYFQKFCLPALRRPDLGEARQEGGSPVRWPWLTIWARNDHSTDWGGGRQGRWAEATGRIWAVFLRHNLPMNWIGEARNCMGVGAGGGWQGN